MSTKTNTPKRLYFRKLANGRISVGEYIRAKWNNVVEPFKPEDTKAIEELKSLIALYNQRESRDVEFESYGGMTEAEFFAVLNNESTSQKT